MNSEQIRAYRQATADRAAAEQGRTVHDQEMIASHDRAVRSGLRVLRDIDHAEALVEEANRNEVVWMRGDTRPFSVILASEVDAAHAEALLDNLPCELCGHVEHDPNHRGARHMHRPATTPQGRAHALIARANSADSLIVPGYVFSTAMMMVAQSNDASEIVGIDHVEAIAENQRADDLDAAVADQLAQTGAWTPVKDLGHQAEPHSRRSGQCRTCGRPIKVRTDDQGAFVSAAHYA